MLQKADQSALGCSSSCSCFSLNCLGLKSRLANTRTTRGIKNKVNTENCHFWKKEKT